MRVISADDMKVREETKPHFTGYVQLQEMLKQPASPISVSCVFFAPKARTNWHSHPEGQVLIVVSGRGRCGSKLQVGGEISEIGPGEVVYFEKDERHWHGAAPY